MSVTTVSTTGSVPTVSLTATSQGRMLLDGKPTHYGDFRDALNVDGYAVIKGAVPSERAKGYSDAFYRYLEEL